MQPVRYKRYRHYWEHRVLSLEIENKSLRMALGDLVSMYGDCPSHAMTQAKALLGMGSGPKASVELTQGKEP